MFICSILVVDKSCLLENIHIVLSACVWLQSNRITMIKIHNNQTYPEIQSMPGTAEFKWSRPRFYFHNFACLRLRNTARGSRLKIQTSLPRSHASWCQGTAPSVNIFYKAGLWLVFTRMQMWQERKRHQRLVTCLLLFRRQFTEYFAYNFWFSSSSALRRLPEIDSRIYELETMGGSPLLQPLCHLDR